MLPSIQRYWVLLGTTGEEQEQEQCITSYLQKVKDMFPSIQAVGARFWIGSRGSSSYCGCSKKSALKIYHVHAVFTWISNEFMIWTFFCDYAKLKNKIQSQELQIQTLCTIRLWWERIFPQNNLQIIVAVGIDWVAITELLMGIIRGKGLRIERIQIRRSAIADVGDCKIVYRGAIQSVHVDDVARKSSGLGCNVRGREFEHLKEEKRETW